MDDDDGPKASVYFVQPFCFSKGSVLFCCPVECFSCLLVYYIVFSLHSRLHKDIINRTMRVEEKTVVTKTKEKDE